MKGVDCTRASSTESPMSPALERGSVPDLRTVSGHDTLRPCRSQ